MAPIWPVAASADYNRGHNSPREVESVNKMPPSPAPRDKSAPGGKIANRLVALSSAAVLTVYAAGYVRTRDAAQRLEAAERTRVVIPEARVASGRIGAPAASAEPARTSPPNPALAVSSPAPAASSAGATQPAAPSVAASKPAVPKHADAVKASLLVADQKGAAPAGTPHLSSPAPKTSQSAAPVPAPTETPASPSVGPVAAALAPAVDAPAAPPTPPEPQYKDGTFSGWGWCRHGDIEATVVIESGRIASAVISKCWTRYSCSWVAHLPGQVVARQSPDVDYVSGATQSANAFYYAVVDALSKAK